MKSEILYLAVMSVLYGAIAGINIESCRYPDWVRIPIILVCLISIIIKLHMISRIMSRSIPPDDHQEQQ